MMDYTPSLAFFDFVPVLLTATGFLYLVRLVSSVLPAQGRIAFLGGTLIVVGGFFKAVWKLLMALSNSTLDVGWMDDGLFVFLAPGYTLFAWSMWQVARSVQIKRIFNAWLFPFLISLIALGTSYFLAISLPDTVAWKRILLTVTVIANFASSILLITFAFRQKLSMAGWLFIINLVCVFVLNGLARLPEQPIFIQWIEEGINTISCLGFAVASWIIYQYARENFGVDASASMRLSATVESGR